MADYIISNGELHRIKNKSELYHWKYKYKKKINGKWRYYYDDPSPLEWAKSKLGYATKDYADGAKEMWRFYSGSLPGFEKSKKNALASKNLSKYGELSRQMSTSEQYRDHYIKEYKQAISDYKKTPLYKVRKAKKKLAESNIGETTKSAINKGKIFTTSAGKKAASVYKKAKTKAAKGKRFVESKINKVSSSIAKKRKKAARTKEAENNRQARAILNQAIERHKREVAAEERRKRGSPGNHRN